MPKKSKESIWDRVLRSIDTSEDVDLENTLAAAAALMLKAGATEDEAMRLLAQLVRAVALEC